jgi:type VI secretion system protein ImpG
MDQLLPYYESELAYLRHNLREFAERYPRVAGRLLISGEVCEDPHTERMIQSFAFLNARIARRLDDDYPEFTEALFGVLYPHYLRPFPSCSIAQLGPAITASTTNTDAATGAAAAQQTSVTTIGRGAAFNTRPVRSVECTFRTVYPVTVAPLAITRAAFSPIIGAPDTVRLPAGATASISLRVAITCDGRGLDALALPALRLFLDGEPSLCAALRDALLVRTVAAYVQADGGHWIALPALPVRSAGFGDDEALIDFPARSHAAYRLLTEYFCFPEKFNFVDLDLAMLTAALPRGTRALTVHLALAGIRSDSNLARMLGTLSTNNLLTGCTPVINLFPQRGEPIQLTHAKANYPVLADGRRAYGYEVNAINDVNMVRQTAQGETIIKFQPFYSLKHAQTPQHNGHYWAMARDEALAERSPGFETQITIVDIDFDPAKVEKTTLNLELTCTNRDLPSRAAAVRPARGRPVHGRRLGHARHHVPAQANAHLALRARPQRAVAPDFAAVAEPPVAGRWRRRRVSRNAGAARCAPFGGFDAPDRRHPRDCLYAHQRLVVRQSLQLPGARDRGAAQYRRRSVCR